MTTCDSRFRGVVNTYDCDQPAGHTGPHQTHHSDGELTTWDDRAVDTPRESAPSAATARPRVELARALDRDTLRRILDRIALGAALTDAQRHALRRTTTAEQADADQARADANRHKANYLSACKTIAEMHAAATGSIGQGPTRGVVEDVADVRSELLATRDGIGQLRAEHETRRHALRRVTTAEQDEVDDLREQVLDARNIHEGARLAVSDALSLGTGAPWDALVERARRLDATERNSRADVAAARQAEQQAGETLVTRHRQLCDALGVGPYSTTSWPDLIETARRVFEAGPVRRAAVVDAEQALAAAEQRARDTAATLRETEQQLAATRRDAADARIRAGHAWAERNRYRDAWHNARRRAAVLSAELTRRAYDGTMYASRAEAAEATLARVRTAVTAARACMTAMDLTEPAQCLQCGADHLAATEAALAQPPADPCDCGQTDCTECVPVQCATPAPGAEPPHCTCAGVGFGTGTCAVHYPPEPAPPAELPCFHPLWQTIGLRRRCTGCREWLDPDPTPALDGAALWAAIRDHAARDHQFWDRLQHTHRARPAGFPVTLR